MRAAPGVVPDVEDVAHVAVGQVCQDPGETRDLAGSEPARVEALRARLASLRSGERGIKRTEETAEARERLAALGYLSAAAPAVKERYGEDDDPKRLIGLDRLLQQALTRYTSGDLPGALALCEDLVKRRSDMPLTWQQLGFLRRAIGDLPGAVAAMKRAIALKPDDADTVALLGIYLNEAGSPREAERLLAPFARGATPDLDVLIAHGVSLAALGRRQDALAAFERVRTLDASHALAPVNIGTVHLMAGEHAEAVRWFAQASSWTRTSLAPTTAWA